VLVFLGLLDKLIACRNEIGCLDIMFMCAMLLDMQYLNFSIFCLNNFDFLLFVFSGHSY
jgi:hypothetical protein